MSVGRVVVLNAESIAIGRIRISSLIKKDGHSNNLSES
ncbi:hypothetical protein SAMN04515695_2567 [Pseudovibrio sp. Tun.PSC04-5.I4]|nr:hypothetical protein SAMN04515695_2567 [Pseudovibrio sp. Tun.PSC04-5.I4]